jgi:hypothetical protein
MLNRFRYLLAYRLDVLGISVHPSSFPPTVLFPGAALPAGTSFPIS